MAYNPEMYNDWWYPRRGPSSDVNWNAGVYRYPNYDTFQRNSRHPDDIRQVDDSPYRYNHLYQDESRYESHHSRGRHQVRQTPYRQAWQTNQPMCREKLHKERPGSLSFEGTSGGSEGGSEEEEQTTRKRKSTPLKTIAAEKTVEALAEEKFKRKVAEDEQRKASEKEIEEKWLKEKEEAEEKQIAEKVKALADQREAIMKELEVKWLKERRDVEETQIAEKAKALADQREAIVKEIEDQENAAKAELERQTEAKIREQELKESIEAAIREAERRAAEDIIRAEQEKADADRIEEARWEAKAQQDAEIMYERRMKKEESDRDAAEKEILEKQRAERIDEIIMLVGLLVIENNPTERKETQSKKKQSKTATRYTPSQKISIQKAAISKAKSIAAGHNEKIILALQKLVPQSSKVDDSGDKAALSKDEVDPDDENETDSLHKVASGSARGSDSTVGQENEASDPKEGKKVGKSNRKSKGIERQEECSIRQEKKKTAQNCLSEKEKSARRTIEWFAGKSYLTR